jgi:MFS family permease
MELADKIEKTGDVNPIRGTVTQPASGETVVRPSGEKVIVKLTSQQKRYFIFVFIVAFLGVMLGQMDAAMFSFVLPQISAEFKLPVGDVGLIVSLGFVVGAVVAFILGPIQDRIGRKLLFNITVFVTGLFSGLTAFVTTLATLVGVRVGTGVGSWIEWGPGTTIISEESLSRWRVIAIAILNLSYPLGFAIASVLSFLIVPTYGWRALFYVAFVPLIIVGISRFFTKETKRFEDLKKQREAGPDVGTYKINLEKAKFFPIKQLFDHDLRRTTIYLTIALACVFFVNFSQYYGVVALTAPSMGALPYAKALLVSTVGYIVYTIGYFVSGFIAKKWGYKKNILYGLGTAIPMTIIFSFIAHGVWEWIVYPLYLLSIVGIWWPCTLNLEASIFPTRVRATGLGYALLIGGLSTAFWIALGGYIIDTVGVNAAYALMLAPIVIGLIFFALISNVSPTAALEEINV